MTKQELNRDIKRLFNKIQSLQLNYQYDPNTYINFIEGEGKKEYLRLYYADRTTEYLTKNSLVTMMTLNRSHRFVQFHVFYCDAKI